MNWRMWRDRSYDLQIMGIFERKGVQEALLQFIPLRDKLNSKPGLPKKPSHERTAFRFYSFNTCYRRLIQY
ncbi:hypothetical protein D7M11_31375 [Paenibacillus ginsengarvi]|uniref:Uncharacterized protein n=1 Tax=Paenibacillus ginsengarvi TaxID=400777 RepID=A0A3B0B5R5_9BACL|nr:hypothetical protein D7M11_31375 [Paenibacillus ginsengarvi]